MAPAVRALPRESARDAAVILLQGGAEPEQIGAFLMLLRYRGEDADELAGLVEGFRAGARIEGAEAALDWPSYGAGRTRGAPWFLLAALALAQAGTPVLMHGTNEFSGGIAVPDALRELGVAQVVSHDHARQALQRTGFAYVPATVLCPKLAALLGLRRLLGLRSPLNTVARLLNPADAPAGVDGVFHPPYIETHLATAERLERPRLLVLKGGGGEAERNPARPVVVHLLAKGLRDTRTLPVLHNAAPPDPEPPIAAVWRGECRDDAIEARIVGSLALGLLAADRGADAEAAAIWKHRRTNLC